MMGSIIEQLADEYEGKAKVVKQTVGARPKAEVEAMLQ